MAAETEGGESKTSTWLGHAPQFRLEVSWLPETAEKAERLRAAVQAKPVVEMAATTLALVIAHNFVHLGQVDVTERSHDMHSKPRGGAQWLSPQ
jgi:hypothetical protein